MHRDLLRIMTFVFKTLIALINCSDIFALKEHCIRVDTKTLKCNYIPKHIPNGTYFVRILDFIELGKIVEVNSSQFETDNWKRVKSLELTCSADIYDVSVILKSKCFHGLKTLKELNIHLASGVRIDPDVFTGLDTLTMLNMSGCVRLRLTDIIPCLNGTRKLPSLENLILSGLNFYREPPMIIDIQFAQALEGKNVTSLDFSHTKISEINTTALSSMTDLKNVNLSYSTISHVSIDENTHLSKFKHMHELDVSHSHVFWLFPSVKIFNMTWSSSDIRDKWHYILAPKIVNFSACIPDSSPFWVINCSLNVNLPLQLNSQEVILRQNNIKHLDIKMQCDIYAAITIKHIDLAMNGLDFLHPSIPTCFPNLERLDLSGNQLFKMVKDHRLLFEQIPIYLHRLKMINLSANILTGIPEHFFIQNHDLEKIDLSHNELDQVTFTLQHLEKLQVLNLQYNRIKILNGLSINNLDSITTMVPNLGDIKTSIHLEYNPISCSECKAKKFIRWLTSTKSVNIPTSHLRCATEKGVTQKINHHALELVKDICNKKMIIISASVSVGLSVLIAVVITTLLYKYRKWTRNRANRMNLLNKLQEGQAQYEFVAFLSHSHDDKNFVEHYLTDQLNENLQLMTGIERNLVCTGDLYFRPGFWIVDETAQCIERASAFIVVVSDSYCTSMYCHQEIDLAYRLNKPIILMMKGHVDDSLMMPTMKMLFRSNVRVLW